MKLVLDGIGHSFLGRTVFENINFSVGENEVVALVGPSGCGKTTILQIAAGLIEPMRGRVHCSCRRHATVFQEPRLLPWMTARDNIAYGLRASGVERAVRSKIAERRGFEVGLSARDLDKYPAELSGGMRQRAAVARALAVDPDLVFFDEPFTAADVGLRRALQDIVITSCAKAGLSALFVTHDLWEAARVAHRLIVMDADGLIASYAMDGLPGERSERMIFDMVEQWSSDPAFAALFDAERSAA